MNASYDGIDLSNCNDSAPLAVTAVKFVVKDTPEGEELGNYLAAVLEAATQPELESTGNNSSNPISCTSFQTTSTPSPPPTYGPTDIADFTIFPDVKIYTQHAPPSPPPPSPPPPSMPPPSAPPLPPPPTPPPSTPAPDYEAPYINSAVLDANNSILRVLCSEL